MPRPRKHTLHEIRDTAGRIFEIYCLPNKKEAWRLAKHRLFASSPYHIGIRRILRVIDGEQWPVLEQEAAYITAARERADRAAATSPSAAELKQRAQQLAQQQREAADAVATYTARTEALRADQRARRVTLDQRLGRIRPIPTLPTIDPATSAWI